MESDRQCTKPGKEKNYRVRHHKTWEKHSKMSLPGIVFIVNRVFNTGLNGSFVALNDVLSTKQKQELIHRQGKIQN